MSLYVFDLCFSQCNIIDLSFFNMCVFSDPLGRSVLRSLSRSDSKCLEGGKMDGAPED